MPLQVWVCPSSSLCRQASGFPAPGGRDLPSQNRGTWECAKKAAGETLGQELRGHSVSLHHHLNQLECWHHGLALGWSTPAPRCLKSRSAGSQRAKQSLRCPAPSPVLKECSARRRHKHRDVCSARIGSSSERTSWDDSRETEGGPCLIFIIPSQLHSHPLIFSSLGS